MIRRTAFKTNYDPVIQYLIEGRKFSDNNRCCGKFESDIVIIMMTGNTAA